MDTHAHPAPDVNPQELGRAAHGWDNFTKFAKYGIFAIIGILVLMGIFLL